MTQYLEAGWYQLDNGERKLRTEVVDGAMDAAGLMVRSKVPFDHLQRVALQVRSFLLLADPQMRGHTVFDEAARARLLNRLVISTDPWPSLQAFVVDCLEQVNEPHDLMAFYLHLIHISRMMQLLTMAQHRKPQKKDAKRPRLARAKKYTPRRPKAAAKKAKKKSKSKKKKVSAKKKSTGKKKSKKKLATKKKLTKKKKKKTSKKKGSTRKTAKKNRKKAIKKTSRAKIKKKPVRKTKKTGGKKSARKTTARRKK